MCWLLWHSFQWLRHVLRMHACRLHSCTVFARAGQAVGSDVTISLEPGMGVWRSLLRFLPTKILRYYTAPNFKTRSYGTSPLWHTHDLDIKKYYHYFLCFVFQLLLVSFMDCCIFCVWTNFQFSHVVRNSRFTGSLSVYFPLVFPQRNWWALQLPFPPACVFSRLRPPPYPIQPRPWGLVGSILPRFQMRFQTPLSFHQWKLDALACGQISLDLTVSPQTV